MFLKPRFLLLDVVWWLLSARVPPWLELKSLHVVRQFGRMIHLFDFVVLHLHRVLPLAVLVQSQDEYLLGPELSVVLVWDVGFCQLICQPFSVLVVVGRKSRSRTCWT